MISKVLVSLAAVFCVITSPHKRRVSGEEHCVRTLKMAARETSKVCDRKEMMVHVNV